jgi:superfamily II DNA or RNA helicase
MVYAVVRGNEDYVVRLEIEGQQVSGTCTCPYFSDRLQICKHLWAVVLECDRRKVLQLPDATRTESLQFHAAPLDDGGKDDEWAVDDPEFHVPSSRAAALSPERRPAPRKRVEPPAWHQALDGIAAAAVNRVDEHLSLPGQLLYVIDIGASKQSQSLVVHLFRQDRKQNGEWGVPKTSRLHPNAIPKLPDADRTILERVLGGRTPYSYGYGYGYGYGYEVPSPFHLRGTVARDAVPVMCEAGRCFAARTGFVPSRPQESGFEPLTWDPRAGYRCALEVTRDDEQHVYRVDGAIEGPDGRIPLSDVQLLLQDGLAIANGRVFSTRIGFLNDWIQHLAALGSLRVPVAQEKRLRKVLQDSGASSDARLPEELRTTIVDAVPVPHLLLSQGSNPRSFLASIGFSYAGGEATELTPSAVLVETGTSGVMARRMHDVEARAHVRLGELGVRPAWDTWLRASKLQVAANDVAQLVRTLLQEGWHVEGEGGQRYRLATMAPSFDVRSGIDWFELHGHAEFGDERVQLPALLQAVERRDGLIQLSDGSIGMMPEEWLRQLSPLAMGEKDGTHVRFKRTQVALLDALLAARPEVSWDEAATAARDRIRTFDAVAPLDPPDSFVGTLREYQRDALGWLASLRGLGFGGCLADDMGLGKTVVVLALLDARRRARESGRHAPVPSLVVVPRSVLFNWQQEAARFAPRLRVLDFAGAGRTDRMHQIEEADLVLVTYGTLRRDAPALADVEFDYVVLDEAQTIKNANTAGAKAARLLRGQHRLALSGTPVENRLTDLWSLFEFLNPGLLSGATAFTRSFGGNADPDDLRLLGRGLRPFILRRTKEQVELELPPKVEQTIVCELERPQRALYDELRDHYRRALLGRSAAWQQRKLQVLEALLRLRQAACHPALVDPRRQDDASAKLDLLIPRLVETLEEGHKALVFSQFTSFLSLLKARLDTQRIAYEYLDGQTRDRQERIERFQNDPSCPLFLISLKAGGVGLNLTAADYVFILDPWWNPAAEAQAVDRTHRIGQTRHVFAYRLIAKDTVEERVLELQQRKRELADAIITADNSLVRNLKREDLELLLS